MSTDGQRSKKAIEIVPKITTVCSRSLKTLTEILATTITCWIFSFLSIKQQKLYITANVAVIAVISKGTQQAVTLPTVSSYQVIVVAAVTQDDVVTLVVTQLILALNSLHTDLAVHTCQSHHISNLYTGKFSSDCYTFQHLFKKDHRALINCEHFYIYTMSGKNGTTLFLPLTLPNAGQFS